MQQPTLWKFIDGMRVVEKSRDFLYEQFIRGDQPPGPVKRKKYLDTDARIRTIVTPFA